MSFANTPDRGAIGAMLTSIMGSAPCIQTTWGFMASTMGADKSIQWTTDTQPATRIPIPAASL